MYVNVVLIRDVNMYNMTKHIISNICFTQKLYELADEDD